jgi:hypothetical protein
MKTNDEKKTAEAVAAATAEEAAAEEAAAEKAVAEEAAAEEAVAEAALAEAALAEEAAPRDTAAAFFASLSLREREALIGALTHLAESEREREAQRAKEAEARAIAEMEKSPNFKGIAERADAIRALSAAVPWLGALPLYERLSAAYYIDRGMRYGEPTKEDLLEAALCDRALGAELARVSHEANAKRAKTLPPVSKKKGTSATPATVKGAPRNLAEATDAAKKYLRFYK